MSAPTDSKTAMATALLESVDSNYSETILPTGTRIRTFRMANGGRKVVIMDRVWLETTRGREE